MNFFLDTEFYERPGRIDLISIGLVCEDGREYYAQNSQAPFWEIEKDEWLKKNVLAQLTGQYRIGSYGYHDTCYCIGDDWRSKGDIAEEVLAFVGNGIGHNFWGYFADYDWVAFCWLFGRMIDLPKNFPMYCLDLKQTVSFRGFPESPIPQPQGEHNALTDARWNRDLWRCLFPMPDDPSNAPVSDPDADPVYRYCQRRPVTKRFAFTDLLSVLVALRQRQEAETDAEHWIEDERGCRVELEDLNG